jgi:hypothetical protein
MLTVLLTQRVYSDLDFNCDALCVLCEQPVRRDEGGERIHHALAIATDDTGYDFFQVPTICSDCLSLDGYAICKIEAMDRASDLDAMRYRYQVVGTAEQRESITDYISEEF